VQLHRLAGDVNGTLTYIRMSAHAGLTAWNEPIGRPNCFRTRAYLIDLGEVFTVRLELAKCRMIRVPPAG
jgi:hypothetical protein